MPSGPATNEAASIRVAASYSVSLIGEAVASRSKIARTQRIRRTSEFHRFKSSRASPHSFVVSCGSVASMDSCNLA